MKCKYYVGVVTIGLLSTGVALASSGKRSSTYTFENPANFDKLVGVISHESSQSDINDQADISSPQALHIDLSASSTDYSYTGSATGVTSATVKNKTNSLIPGFSYARRLNPNTVFVMSYSEPFNINNSYSSSDFDKAFSFPTLRYLRITDFSPGLSFKLSDKVRFGAALDATRGQLKVNNSLGNGAYNLGSLTADLSGTGLGYHMGLRWNQPWLGAFLGASYFSKIKYDLKGSATKLTTTTNDATSSLTQPYAVKLRYTQFLDQKTMAFVSLLAEYTNWSVLPAFNVTSSATGAISDPLGYSNTWMYQLAYSRLLNNPKWRLTGALIYDNSPGEASLKSPTSTEPPHYWIAAVKANYAINPRWSMEGSVYYAFLNDININYTNPTSPVTYKGTVKVKSFGFGLGATYNFS
jgi:hypothetical protein